MDITTMIFFALAAAALTLLSACFLSAPLPIGWRAAVNAAMGLAALYLVNATGNATGLSLDFDLFNGLIVGILGISGLGLLFLIRWVFT